MEIKRVAHQEFLSADEAALVLGVSKETLRFWRYTNKHVDEIPPLKHVSRRIFYRTADVMKFSRTMYCPA
ncbi:helix-turn-helix domain-containing protein [Pseudomonas asiatica]|uniref:helix-turn-helix domain-containing protein n=1 Tax=Pseudomonas asiatica TaxID=2219225 RepID=UPI0025A1380E|nr:helix-turn-helix domain-containing protein [Pseudomonas asiatica]MDM9588307.1 helix-turn-helix domain-containing protein [Pseudomonas asiatica]WJM51587.1 helix-turn-helix domain-containing protein [Pseudomonas asiatica]